MNNAWPVALIKRNTIFVNGPCFKLNQFAHLTKSKLSLTFHALRCTLLIFSFQIDVIKIGKTLKDIDVPIMERTIGAKN